MDTKRIKELEGLAKDVDIQEFFEEAIDRDYDDEEILEAVEICYTKEQLATAIMDEIFLNSKRYF